MERLRAKLKYKWYVKYVELCMGLVSVRGCKSCCSVNMVGYYKIYNGHLFTTHRYMIVKEDNLSL